MLEKQVNFDVMTPVGFLSRSKAVYPDKTAVVYGDRRFTYNEFSERVNRLAGALFRAGVEKGDKVAFICPNTPPMLEAHYAVPMIGAALVSVNIRLSAQEILYIIDHSEAKAVFVDNEFAETIKDVIPQMRGVKFFVNICDISDDRPIEGMEYEEFLGTGSHADFDGIVADEYEVIAINYTSGTTGRPKGVMYHHRGAYISALGEAMEFGLNSESVYLWTLPMFHCNGWCFTWAVTAVGGTHVCLRKVVPAEIYQLIKTENITHMCAAPTILISMSEYAVTQNIRMPSHVEIMTAGAPPSPTVIKNMESMGANVTQTYGLTEVYGPFSICEWQTKWNSLSAEDKAGIKSRQGVPYITALYMDVVDSETMTPVPHDGNTIGEIVMRGNMVMLGYYKDPESTVKAFDGGWFHSGDLAVIHPDGYVQIVDRKKDIIISGGENISTVEVENVLYSYPDVLEVAVIPVPDEKWGEVPKAFIALKSDASATEKDIIDFCKANMARFKAPKSVEFADLPKTATGKIQKYKLMEKEWNGRKRIAA